MFADSIKKDHWPTTGQNVLSSSVTITSFRSVAKTSQISKMESFATIVDG